MEEGCTKLYDENMSRCASIYPILADCLLIAHFVFVSFVVLGFVVTWVGYFFKWRFIRNIYFRIAHMACMGIVALQAVVGTICPLTVWEDGLRRLSGAEGRYEGSFIQHWLHKVLYYDISLQTFAVIYTLFFFSIILTLFLIKPQLPGRSSLPHT